MRILIFDHIHNARQSLRTNRLRTMLTVVGVAIGVASITVILSLSSGVINIINNQVDSLGGNIAVIRPGSPPKQINDLSNPVVQQAFATSTISEKDATDVRQIKDVTAAAPIMTINGSVRSQNTTAKTSTIVATTPDLANTVSLPIRDGQFLDATTDSNTAVVGSQLSVDLFGTEQSIGKTFTIRERTFRVIGILKRLNDPINFNTVNFDHAAIISLESGKSFHNGMTQIQQINVRAESVEKMPEVLKAVTTKLADNHLGEKDVTVLSGKEIARPTNQFFISITTVMTVIAAISLVVGGVGIMNIMLVGVAERTREIGLRKAVGASSANIVWQFMIEALIMSLVGGVFGYLGGYVIAFIISSVLSFDPAFTWQIAATAISVALVTGGIFGLYPAIRAARKDPIESLRHYH